MSRSLIAPPRGNKERFASICQELILFVTGTRTFTPTSTISVGMLNVFINKTREIFRTAPLSDQEKEYLQTLENLRGGVPVPEDHRARVIKFITEQQELIIPTLRETMANPRIRY